MKLTLGLFLSLLVTQITSAQEKIITIHQNGGATILEEKAVALQKGTNTFPVEGFISGYNPESIFLYSNSSPIQAMLQKKGSFQDLLMSYKGEEVAFQFGENERIAGKLTDLKFGGAFLTLKDGSMYFLTLGSIKSYQLPAKKVDFLYDDTVFGTMNSDKKQSSKILVWYQTSSFRWSPQYKLILNESMTEAAFQGVAKIDYNGDVPVDAASVRLSFGNMNQYRPSPSYSSRDMSSAKAMAMEPAYEEVVVTSVNSVGDAYEVALNQKISFKPDMQLQIVQTDVKKIPIKKWYEIYSYGSAIENNKPTVVIEFKTDKKSGFENPLASGQLDIMLLKDNELKSLAAQGISNVGLDESVKLTIGKAMDILIKEEITKDEQVTKKIRNNAYKIEVKNNKKETVKVRVVRNLNSNTRITDASMKYQIENEDAIFWLEIGAGKVVSFTYSTKTEYM